MGTVWCQTHACHCKSTYKTQSTPHLTPCSPVLLWLQPMQPTGKLALTSTVLLELCIHSTPKTITFLPTEAFFLHFPYSIIWPLTLPQKLFVPHTYEQKFQQDRWHFYDVGILQQNKTFMAYAQGITSLTGLCDPIGPAPDYSYTGICPNNTLPLGDLQEVSNRPPDKHIAFCNLCSQKLTLQNKHPMKICWIHGNLDLTSVLNMLHRQITACW